MTDTGDAELTKSSAIGHETNETGSVGGENQKFIDMSSSRYGDSSMGLSNQVQRGRMPVKTNKANPAEECSCSSVTDKNNELTAQVSQTKSISHLSSDMIMDSGVTSSKQMDDNSDSPGGQDASIPPPSIKSDTTVSFNESYSSISVKAQEMAFSSKSDTSLTNGPFSFGPWSTPVTNPQFSSILLPAYAMHASGTHYVPVVLPPSVIVSHVNVPSCTGQ